MKLLIVESPAKAKTISKYLNDEYTVKASVGHIRDLPKSNKNAIDIEGGFIPHYEISKGKEAVVAEIKSLAKKATEVLLATDPDREGEAIAWHIAEAAGLKDPQRVVFHEITKDAVQEAIKHPRPIDDNLKQAQEARRVLDRLVGYDLSGLIWKKVRYGLSAGRVQSPALRIIMEREREIRAFIPEKFWVITADVKNKQDVKFTLTCNEEPRDEKFVEKIFAAGKVGPWTVSDLKETEVARGPKAPFITSTLQQTASSRLGFAPSRTMGIAQKLYEAGYISYMRTDSTNLSKVAIDQMADIIKADYGDKYLMPRVFTAKSKNAQEAHEAIRPTDLSKKTAGHTPEQQKLYQLIWSRTVASQMADAKTLRTKLSVKVGKAGEAADDADKKSAKEVGTDTIPDFSINGSRVLFDGWLAADPEARQDDVELPKTSIGEVLRLIDIHSEQKQTEPPARYSEAGLIKELEKRGIGRPSTYASIIKTIQDRGYVSKEQKALVPTDTGDVVSSWLEENFANYISDTFTAEMEDELDAIARGEMNYTKTLKDFYGPFKKDVKAKDKSTKKITDLGPVEEKFKCPVCGSPMIWKLSRNGKFMSCSRFPDCQGARIATGEVMEGPKLTGEKCPLCADGMLMERMGRFGKFTACSNYPKCKYIKKDEAAEKARSTGVKCNLCGVGEMTEKRGRFGVFYGCTNYPTCKNIIKAKPTGRICELCKSLMMEGTKTIPERCSNKLCPNHNPHKLEKK